MNKRFDSELKSACHNTFISGLNWYEGCLGEDGFFGVKASDEAAYYNTLYLFGLGGRWEAAERFGAWARKNIISEDHTLRVACDGLMASRSIYFKGWNVFGSHHCEMHDMSLGAVDRILLYQDEKTGGFVVSERGFHDEAVIDLNATSLCGLAALVTGRKEAAEAAGDCVVRIVELQPDFPQKMYSYLRYSTGELITCLPESLSNMSESDDIYSEKKTAIRTEIDRYHFCLDNGSDKVEPYAIFSMALVFIVYMYKATRKQAYLNTAQKLYDFCAHAGDKCWIEGQTTKVLWGMVLLYTETKNPALLATIERFTKHLCDTQVPGKGWVSPIIGGEFDDQPMWVSLALTGDVLKGLGSVLRYLK